jgi:hypothetical protein
MLSATPPTTILFIIELAATIISKQGDEDIL